MNAGPPRVLIADDDPVGSAFLVGALAPYAAACDVVRDGRTALVQARAQRYDLLLLDLRMPACSGLEVLEALRADPAAASRRTRAYALSAEIGPQQRLALQRAGFVDALQKPVALATIEAIIGGVAAGAGTDHNPHGPAPGGARVLDDAAALASCGSAEVVAGLRELLRAELPAQLHALDAALAGSAVAIALEHVHRLRGACRFVGAVELEQTLAGLGEALRANGDASVGHQRVAVAGRRLLAALSA